MILEGALQQQSTPLTVQAQLTPRKVANRDVFTDIYRLFLTV